VVPGSALAKVTREALRAAKFGGGILMGAAIFILVSC
jgi:hypothetical protein